MSAFDPTEQETSLGDEFELIRTGLAELDRSPDLEDAVAAIAREAPHETRGYNSPRLLTWLVPAAAAMIVVAVLFLRGGTDRLVPGDDHELKDKGLIASVVVPPSAAEVDAARRGNDLPAIEAGNTLRFGYRCEFGEGGLFEMWTDEHIAPIPKSKHRWVLDRKEGLPTTPKTYQYLSFPQEEGVLLMGPELLVPDGAMIRGAGGSIEVHTQKGAWKPVAGTRFLELTLGSPEEGGARARVRCVLSTAYTGTLLVTEPLARALGLNHFELPGGFVARLGGQEQPIRGQRALARFSVPELSIDRVVEVQARAPHRRRDLGRPPKSGMKNHGAIVVSGALPSRIAHCDALSIRHDGTLIVHMDGDGNAMTLATDKQGDPVQLGIWNAGPVHLGLIYAGTDERPAATVVLGAYDFENKRYPVYAFDAAWVTLAQTDEPGARVTIAKVWRGTQAIPSDEGVVVTTVGADGRIRFPRVAGEPGSTLRMHVLRKASSAFHEVVLDEPPSDTLRIAFHARADGEVAFAASSWPALTDPHAAIAGIQAEMTEWIEAKRRQDPSTGPSDWLVEISAERDASWQTVQCILHAAAQAGVRRIRHYAIGATPAGDPGATFVDNALATDQGLVPPGAPEPPRAAASVLVRPRKAGGFELRLTFDLPRRDGDGTDKVTPLSIALAETTDAALRARILRTLGESVRGKMGRIQLIPGSRTAPYAAIQTVLEAFHAAGATQVLFEAPVPAPVRNR